MKKRQGIREIRSDKDFMKIEGGSEIEKVINHYNIIVEYMNQFNKTISFQSNFDSRIVEATFSATGAADGSDTQKINHFLGVTPKYRIILRQTGNGVLEDVDVSWNNQYITLKNRGSEVVKATIMIVRE